MTKMKKSHKIAFIIAGILAITSLGISLYFWDQLPSVIPTHFGFNGQPDDWSPKTIWSAFMMPMIQLLIMALLAFLYYKPQYSDMPTTLWLMTMEEHKKEHAFDLIRVMLVGTALWMGLLFTYITLTINQSALTSDYGINGWIMLFLLGGMISWLTWWTVRVYRSTREAIKKLKPKK